MLNTYFLRLVPILLVMLTSTVKADTQPSSTKADKETHSTADFSRVVARTKELVAAYSQDGVLVVVDIDNTLLAMNQDLGTDQWFNWQSGLLKEAPESPDLVASNFDGLLEVQGTLFGLSRMHPPEPELPSHMAAIQQLGVTTVVLTSRGYTYRDASERELKRNGYNLAPTSLRINEVRGPFMPFDAARPNAHGLTSEAIARIQNRRALVSYSSGIYMTAGQHKGYMLRTLLARANPKRNFKAIVFVDDHEKHTTRMHEAYAESPIHLVTFHYTREAGNVSNFNASNKRHVVEDWRRLEDFIDSVLVR